MGTQYTQPGFKKIARHDAIFQEKIHDTYQIKSKLKEPTVCPLCSAVFHEGRWQWLEAPASAHPHNCPACQRTHDRYHKGDLEFHYNPAENLLRVYWSR